MKTIRSAVTKNSIILAWMVALAASFGSLILSEVMELRPCTLCWYQRIFMFSLAFVLGVGVYRKDGNVSYYVLPLSITGGLIAFYHSLLQWGIISETSITCTVDSSCAEPQINWFGFITIPFMALVTFIIISALAWLPLRKQQKES